MMLPTIIAENSVSASSGNSLLTTGVAEVFPDFATSVSLDCPAGTCSVGTCALSAAVRQLINRTNRISRGIVYFSPQESQTIFKTSFNLTEKRPRRKSTWPFGNNLG